MLGFMKRWIPDSATKQDAMMREKIGVTGGMLGIGCNGVLFLIKIFVGLMGNSIAVISDAFNNLSDMGSALISVAGAKISNRLPDADHPYGHGRGEYLSALLVAILIFLFGFELFKEGIQNLFQPKETTMSPLLIGLLCFSILVKLGMYWVYSILGKSIDSTVLLASAKDSRNDAIATAAVVCSALLAPYTTVPLDGIMGVFVSVLILASGYGVARDTVNKLMGQKPDESLCAKIEQMVLADEMILGMHDLMVHDYGPGHTIASVHAEVPDHLSLIAVHDVIDRVEREILDTLHVDIVIHMDPIPKSPDQDKKTPMD